MVIHSILLLRDDEDFVRNLFVSDPALSDHHMVATLISQNMFLNNDHYPIVVYMRSTWINSLLIWKILHESMEQRIVFKILLLTFKSLNDLGLNYICDLL